MKKLFVVAIAAMTLAAGMVFAQDMTRPSGLDTMLGQHISVAASGRSHHLLCFSLPKCPSQKIRNRLVNQTMETNA